MIDMLKNMADSCPQDKALLGLDVGKKTIGVALCHGGHALATPLLTIKRTKFTRDILELEALVKEYDVGGFIIGLPVNMDGSEGPRAQSVRDFAAELVRYPAVVGAQPWVALWDERLSTVSVEDMVDTFVDKKSKRRGAKDSGLIDKLAAHLILEGALEFMKKD